VNERDKELEYLIHQIHDQPHILENSAFNDD
jgi:hypothetical protein